MTSVAEISRGRATPALGTFERYLTVWVALCIVAGIVLRPLLPAPFQALGQVRRHWRGIGVTLFINWAVKPFSMAAMAWLFVGYLFRPYLPA